MFVLAFLSLLLLCSCSCSVLLLLVLTMQLLQGFLGRCCCLCCAVLCCLHVPLPPPRPKIPFGLILNFNPAFSSSNTLPISVLRALLVVALSGSSYFLFFFSQSSPSLLSSYFFLFSQTLFLFSGLRRQPSLTAVAASTSAPFLAGRTSSAPPFTPSTPSFSTAAFSFAGTRRWRRS